MSCCARNARSEGYCWDLQCTGVLHSCAVTKADYPRPQSPVSWATEQVGQVAVERRIRVTKTQRVQPGIAVS
jgi:hypothetical protein